MKKLLISLLLLFLLLAVVTVIYRKGVSISDLSRTLEQVPVSDAGLNSTAQEESRIFRRPSPRPDIFFALDGSGVSYVDIVAYPKAVLFLWTTQCQVCRDDLVRISQNCTAYEGVKLLFINLGESQTRVKQFISYYDLKKCVSDRILLDKQGYTAAKFYVTNVPTVVFFEYGTPIYKAYALNDYLIEKVYEKD